MAMSEVLQASSAIPYYRPQDFQSHHHHRSDRQEFQGLEAFRRNLKGFPEPDYRRQDKDTPADSLIPLAKNANMRSALPTRPMASKSGDTESNLSRTRIRSPPPDEVDGSYRSSVAGSPKAFHGKHDSGSNDRYRSSKSPADIPQQPLSPASVAAETAYGMGSGVVMSAPLSAKQQDLDGQSDSGPGVVQGLSGQICR